MITMNDTSFQQQHKGKFEYMKYRSKVKHNILGAIWIWISVFVSQCIDLNQWEIPWKILPDMVNSGNVAINIERTI